MMIINCLILLLLLIMPKVIYATSIDAATLEIFRNEGKNIGNSLLGDVQGFSNNQNQTKEAQSLMSYEENHRYGSGISVPEAEMLGARNKEIGAGDDEYQYKCNKDTCEVGHTLSSQAVMMRQEKINQTMTIRDENGNIIEKKAFVDNILANQKTSAEEFKLNVNGSRNVCTPEEEKFIKTTPDTCDSYYDYNVNTCYPQQIVEIDPRFNYSCNKKREIKEKVCHDEITKISCKPSKQANCFTAGLFTQESNQELIQVSGGLRLKDYQRDGHTILELGNDRHYTYNVGPKGCSIVEFTAKFFIKNATTVSTFALLEVFENDLLHISINGRVIYNGLGGNDLILGPGHGHLRTIYGGNNSQGLPTQGQCWASFKHIHWKNHYYDIKSAGILREGENHIHIKLVYHDLGHAGFKIQANSYCCSEFDIEREEKCKYH